MRIAALSLKTKLKQETSLNREPAFDMALNSSSSFQHFHVISGLVFLLWPDVYILYRRSVFTSP